MTLLEVWMVLACASRGVDPIEVPQAGPGTPVEMEEAEAPWRRV